MLCAAVWVGSYRAALRYYDTGAWHAWDARVYIRFKNATRAYAQHVHDYLIYSSDESKSPPMSSSESNESIDPSTLSPPSPNLLATLVIFALAPLSCSSFCSTNLILPSILSVVPPNFSIIFFFLSAIAFSTMDFRLAFIFSSLLSRDGMALLMSFALAISFDSIFISFRILIAFGLLLMNCTPLIAPSPRSSIPSDEKSAESSSAEAGCFEIKRASSPSSWLEPSMVSLELGSTVAFIKSCWPLDSETIKAAHRAT
mmetsp:Transcript_7460/g.14584  ORF Transcript_7460/g.14584 Transcript_7460/m.14584 type:complete len:257 (+) Transcript_7460:100-870(+)